MLNKLKKTIHMNGLFETSDRILLAVSGGIDSVFMTHLFHKAGLNFGIAHCNFMLRGIESNLDEQFVEGLANKYQVPFFVKKVNAKCYAQENHISTQVAAREIRYRFFEEIIENHPREIKYVATAHHLNDQIETFFINLGRGSGIKGLAGIPMRSGNIVRPILNFTKTEIEGYVFENKLEFRKDQSNDSDNYLRNKIRHHLIPMLEELNPSSLESFSRSLENLNDAKRIYEDFTMSAIDKILIKKLNTFSVSIHALSENQYSRSILHEILNQFGFNASTENQLMRSIGEGTSGKIFYSHDYKLLIDRTELIITNRSETVEESIKKEMFLSNAAELEVLPPMDHLFSVKKIELSTNLIFDKSPNISYLDFDKLHFPLYLRKWEKGDKFQPMGMKGFKKVSDLLIDKKINLYEKDKVMVLLSGEDIVWVVGFRTDERYSIKKDTRKVLKIDFHPFKLALYRKI